MIAKKSHFAFPYEVISGLRKYVHGHLSAVFESFCAYPRMLKGKDCTNFAPGKQSVAKMLQKIVLAACRVCIRANVGCILVSGKHQGCKDAQPGVCQAIHHSLLLPKERKFYGLAKVHWF